MPTIPDALVAPLGDSQRLVQILAEVNSVSNDEAHARLLEDEMHPGKRICDEMAAAGIKPFQWTDKLLEFYSSTDAFLYSSTVWNRNGEKLRLRNWIGEFLEEISETPLRILCYGDGLGFDSLYFNLAGHEADYFEVGELARSFAQHIYDINGQVLSNLSSREEIPLGEYDVIVCLDVLEHVPDPPAMIEEFQQYLKEDGRLIVSAPFYLVNRFFPAHLDSNRRFSGDFRSLYGRFGFKLHEGCIFWNPVVVGRPLATRRRTLRGFAGAMVVRLGGVILTGARIWAAPYGWLCQGFNLLAGNKWIDTLRP